MKNYVIVVAGGKGLRMGGDIPKQFLPVKGKPVLMRTLEAFHACDAQLELILVLPADQQAYWKELCSTCHFTLPHRIADGGETRFHSVRNGLALVDEEGLVGVHDGVRPFVSQEVIRNCYREAAQKEADIKVGLLKIIPLNIGAAEWADRIIKERNYERKDQKSAIKREGFDIKEEALALQDFYLRVTDR